MEAYLPILHSLVTNGITFSVIGTWALKVYFPEAMADYEIRDCDLVLQPTLPNIRRAAETVRAGGWALEVWGTPLKPDFNAQDLEGKFYLRARKEALVMDMTFECRIPWEAMASGIQWQHRLPMASVADILDLKRRKAQDHGQEAETEAFIRRLGCEG